MKHPFLVALSLLLLLGCQSDKKSNPDNPLFNLLKPSQTGIDFSNTLNETQKFDVFRYRNYYNGGGVAIGDINNDGLQDVFLTANMAADRLFLNKGNFQFEDITEKAGCAGTKPWSTGVSMVDINDDGFLDIYVCNSGNLEGGDRENELFINNGDLTFHEAAAEYGLNDLGFSTHACFFDYDGDGDLDCYLLNNSFRPIATLGYRNLRYERDPDGGDKLYRNDNGHFTDVSEAANIFGSVIGFGLGVTVGDVNLDYWPDIYVSNDFYERDYLYINQKNGTFSEELTDRIDVLSNFSMGADMADLNNDDYPEILVTDMLPPDLKRMKKNSDFVDYDNFRIRYAAGFYNQYMRNTLQRNLGGHFSEEAQEIGVAATDWSWGALLCDLDNNGYRDIFVTNGVYKDVTDQDFIAFLADDERQKAAQRGENVDFSQFVEKMPSTKIPNYAFSNTGNFKFEDKTIDWGFSLPTHSNGAAYGDLDNDGDLDLVINNLNDQAMVYRNNTDVNHQHYIRVMPDRKKGNSFCVGDKVAVHIGTSVLTHTNIPNRGFQSSVEMWPPIGIGSAEKIDSIEYFTDNGRGRLVIYDPKINTTATVKVADCKPYTHPVAKTAKRWKKQETPTFRHVENPFIDFDRERLMYRMVSHEGPAFAVADVNNDGLDDFFVGGASGQNGTLAVQTKGGKFQYNPLENDNPLDEEVSACFLDADNDGDPDLYVATGGSEFLEGDPNLEDRLYLNNSTKSKVQFNYAPDALPKIRQNGAVAVPIDVNKDGFTDLFIGNRSVPGYYGVPPDSYMLLNRMGKGFEKGSTVQFAALEKLGMVTAAVAADVDEDGYDDLVVVGDWMPVTVLYNGKGTFKKSKTLENTDGWWTSIKVLSDKAGQKQFVLGNFGYNSTFQPSTEKPIRLYVSDFDKNGSYESILCNETDRIYPYHLKSDLEKVLTFVKKKAIYNKDYAEKSIDELLSKEQLNDARILTAKTFASSILKLNTEGGFTISNLPRDVQLSPVYDFLLHDCNQDGATDLVAFGNFSYAKPEIGRILNNKGCIIFGSQNNLFDAGSKTEMLGIQGDVRHAGYLRTGGKPYFIIAKNNDALEFYTPE